ncbi:hypothetical protein Prubr_70850 [Polymorphospora rubra]|uniref:Glycosyltransferase n=1 Tax=Polymorphospora rubra TaxID=338584 RepID=A0A810NCJ9_9ACTN|nr:hypothetical protein Prubr_70850 [Polymorphospora rubra]
MSGSEPPPASGHRGTPAGAGDGTVLLVVAKAPVPGRVKTRLCPPAGPEQAAWIAAAALLDTIEVVSAVPDVVPVLALEGELSAAVGSGPIVEALDGWTVLAQRGRDLSERLAAAHADAADRYPGSAVLQIGMDTPQVTVAMLTEALDRLGGGVPAVLGPAHDGGWWALGLCEPEHAEVLCGVPMSRSDTADRTLAALHGRDLAVGILPSLSDVDNMADAVAVAAAVPDGRFAAAVRAVVAPEVSTAPLGAVPTVPAADRPAAAPRLAAW